MLFVSIPLVAQTRSVTGVVTSSADGLPVPGAVVTIEGDNTRYAITDIDGNYILENVESGEVLVFTMMGYTTQSVTITNQTVVNVILDEESTMLEEAVVIGYGTVKKKDLTGSVSSVNSEKLKGTVSINVDQMLQGKVAGVQITSNSGAPGSASSIRVRGTSSINNSNEPLYIP